MPAFDKSTLRPGDAMLYGVRSFLGIPHAEPFGLLTSFKTWSPAVHVEVYIGNGLSFASRNGIGVSIYPVRFATLIAVLEPKQSPNIEKALTWANDPFDPKTKLGVRGRPYGWFDLPKFYGIKLKTDGWICSQAAAYFYESADLFPFSPNYDKGTIDPGDYFVPNAFDWKWVKDGIL